MAAERKYWYKISVDAVRGWTAFLTLAVLAAVGVYGYRLLTRHLLDRQVVMTMEEADELVIRLRNEKNLSLHGDKFDSAVASLEEARGLHDRGELARSLLSAQRSRSLLVSIVDALRHRSPTGEAQFVSAQGRVEVRRGDRGEWQPARSRMVVYAGDYIKTSDHASAEVMMVDGSLFTVHPGTVVLVDRLRTTLGLRSERTLALESGWVNLSTSGAGSRVTTPRAEARVNERSEAVVAFDQATEEGRFTSFRGRIEVASEDGATRQVGELEQVVQRGQRLSAAKKIPDAPLVIAPEDNVEVELSADRLALRWKPVTGAAGYDLQVSHNRLFVENIIEVENRTRTTATLGLKRPGSYVWRVSARDREGAQGPWSPTYRFRVVGAGSPGAVQTSAYGATRASASPAEGS